MVDWEDYIVSLWEVASKVTSNFEVNNSVLSNSNFCTLMEAACNCETVSFSYSTINKEDEEWRFNIQKSNIQKLDLRNVGDLDRSDWSNNPNRFLNIFEGILKCPALKKSIKYIYVSDTSLDFLSSYTIRDKIKKKLRFR